MLVIEQAAIRHLQDHEKSLSVQFIHRLCEGVLKQGKEASLGTFHGIVFHAYLGTHNDAPWTCDFILVNGARYIDLDEDQFSVSWVTPLRGGGHKTQEVDVAAAWGVKVKKITTH